jgi:hypothetical protein
MKKDAKALQDFFDINFDQMTELMQKARSIEFKIRLAAELAASLSFREAKNWEEFAKDPRRISRKKLDKHIQELFKSDWKKIHAIKQIADAAAHADYRQARNRIESFALKYNFQLNVDQSDVGVLLAKNIIHQDGSKGDIHYSLNSSDENTILEEFYVFSKQKWGVELLKILKIAEDELLLKFPSMDKKAAALVFSRGLKYGKKISK